MDKFNRQAVQSTEGREDDPARVAESVQRDFSDLIRIFERSLASLPATDSEARAHVAKAKAAAERGLKLSRELIEVLRG